MQYNRQTKRYTYREFTIARGNQINMPDNLWYILEHTKPGGFHSLTNAKEYVDQLYWNAYFEQGGK